MDCLWRVIAAGVLLLALWHPTPAEATSQPTGGRALQLEVFLNGETTKLVGSFVELPEGGLAATRKELQEVGVNPPGEGGEEDVIPLTGMPGLTYQYDEPRQRLDISLALERRMPHVIDAHGTAEAVGSTQAGYGAVLNYMLFAGSTAEWSTKAVEFSGATAQLDARLFTPFGYVSQTAIVGTTAFRDADILRLDTTFTYTDTHSAAIFRAGDLVSRGPAWSRPIRLGGLQAERDFALRPDLITLPLPAVSGSAAVPSTVEVFVNSVRTFSRDVPAGPYAIHNLPVLSGSGTANIVLRDATGRAVETSLPFFTSPQLLRSGLLDYAVQVGFPRFRYAISSNSYAEHLVGIGSLRYGLSDNLTLETHAEGGPGIVNGGAGLVTNVGALGVLAVAGRASNFDGATGYQGFVSFETRLLGLSIGASSQRSFGNFQDLASATAQLGYVDDVFKRFERNDKSDPTTADPLTTGSITTRNQVPRALDRLSVGVPLPFKASSLGLSFINLERGPKDRAHIVAASYFQNFGKSISLSMTAFTDLEKGKDTGVFIGLSMPLGDTIHSSVGATSNQNGQFITAAAGKNLGPDVGSYGWRIKDAEGRKQSYRSAAASYRSSYGRAEALVEQTDARGARGSVEAEGAVVAMASGLFFSNSVDDAFAVVDAGAPDIEVFHENRLVGKTGSSGKILVPSLRSLQKNRIRINPNNLPVDAHIGRTDEVVVPAPKTGIGLDFGIDARSQSAMVTFHDGQGQHLEVGTQGQLEGSSETFVVGYDGRAFLRHLQPSNTAVLNLPGGECRASFDYAPQHGEQVVIGPVACRQTAPAGTEATTVVVETSH
jgi:outer membrane usher protein